jgi:nicotinamide phosphoribosyltransferase
MKLFAPHATDAYKLGHPAQTPKGTELIYSNFTPRSLKRFPVKGTSFVVVAGIQGAIKELKEMWDESFFSKPLDYCIERYSARVNGMIGPGSAAVNELTALHKLGYLPLRIKALPEGSLVPAGVPHFTRDNTHREFAWLTNYIETVLSSLVWKTPTTATIAAEFYILLSTYARLSVGNAGFVPFQGHDFCARGMSGPEDAARTGIGHLMCFMGSDTVSALDYIDDYYRGKESGFIAGSVPASEHMIACSNMAVHGGGLKGELAYVLNMLHTYPSGVVSIVADTADFFRLLEACCTDPEVRETILSRRKDANGLCKTVFRPDSGKPEDILCGECYSSRDVSLGTLQTAKEKGFSWVVIPATRVDLQDEYYEIEMDTPGHWTAVKHDLKDVPLKVRGAVAILWEHFGGTLSEMGYRILSEYVGLIYGDSITYDRAEEILIRFVHRGFASTSSVLGIGSFTYQYLTRDSIGGAMKATYAEVDGKGYALQKTPATDDGTKHSARGLLKVDLSPDAPAMLSMDQTWEQEAEGDLLIVFTDGVFTDAGNVKFSDIRTRLASSLDNIVELILRLGAPAAGLPLSPALASPDPQAVKLEGEETPA